MIDLLIRDAEILDGTGAPALRGDVAVDGGRIVAVGAVGGLTGRDEIDAQGLTLIPGLIDTHAHDDGAFLRYPDMTFKLAQGVTTTVSGNCGFSAVPAAPGRAGTPAPSGGLLGRLAGDFTDLDGYFAAVMAARPAINNLMLVGHNTVREQVMGLDDRAPSRAEIRAMRDHIEHAMAQGACGFSTGLIYRPGRYSDTEEVIELAASVHAWNGLYTTHMRNEGDGLLEAVAETLRIGRETGLHVHISHHKAAGRQNWGRVRESLAAVDQALAAGQQVTLDVYPYTAGSGRMVEYFNLERPNRALAEVIRIASCPAFREFEGRMLVDIAAERGLDITDAVRLILTAPRGDQTLCIHFIIDEADIETNLRHRDMMVGSDGIPDLKGRPHPRLFGTFPRILGHYVRERGILSLPEAVRRMTSLPAAVFGLNERGQIRVGHHADLVLLDPASVRDTATYDDPKQLPVGIHTVIVNGARAFAEGQPTGARPGHMLRYRRSAFGADT
ncbi:MAG: N-acyl-D-amino-acid deacylase family protein [Gammaproteobacteria bacterium]